MDRRPIVFIDSGIGSIPYAIFFHSRNNHEKLILVADRANFPYGPKSKETLIELILSLAERLIAQYDPKILTVACNTASVSALEALRQAFPALPVVGTVPAIKPAVLASRKRCIGVLGTQLTVEDPYIADLAAHFGPDCKIIREAAPSLVEFVEQRWFKANGEERLNAVEPWVEKFLEQGADSLVLACTHFLLLRNEFIRASGENLDIFHSLEGVVRRIESLLDEGGLRAPLGEETNNPVLVITGDEKSYWDEICPYFDINRGKDL